METAVMILVLAMLMTALVLAQEPKAATGQGAFLAKVVFYKPAYDLFQQWTQDTSSEKTYIQTYNDANSIDRLRKWYASYFVKPTNVESSMDGWLVSATFSCEPQDLDVAKRWPMGLIGNFATDMLSAGGSIKWWEKFSSTRQEATAQIETAKAAFAEIHTQQDKLLDDLKRTNEQEIRADLKTIEETRFQLGLTRAELEARLKTIQEKLAQEKPTLLIEAPPSSQEVANPVYTRLKQMLAEAEIDLQGLRAKEQLVQGRQENLEKDLGRLHEATAQINDLQKKKELQNEKIKFLTEMMDRLSKNESGPVIRAGYEFKEGEVRATNR